MEKKEFVAIFDKEKFEKEVEKNIINRLKNDVFMKLQKEIDSAAVKKRFIKQKDVAKIFGVSIPTIINYEKENIIHGSTIVENGSKLYSIDEVNAVVAMLDARRKEKYEKFKK